MAVRLAPVPIGQHTKTLRLQNISYGEHTRTLRLHGVQIQVRNLDGGGAAATVPIEGQLWPRGDRS